MGFIENAADFLRTPGYRRSVVLRRCAAVVLVIAAGGYALLDRAGADSGVVVFTRDVSPGDVIGSDDVAVKPLPEDIVPDSVIPSIADAEGQVIASHASAGEVVTATRLLGPDLVSALVGDKAEGYTMVPVKLADPDVIPMLHHGNHVSVVTAGDGSAQTVAESGIVVSTGAEEDENNSGVLLLLKHEDAEAVAAASLTSPLTVVLGVKSVT